MTKKLMLALAAILTLGSLTQLQAHRGWGGGGRSFGLGFAGGLLGSSFGRGFYGGHYPGYYSYGYSPYSYYGYYPQSYYGYGWGY